MSERKDDVQAFIDAMAAQRAARRNSPVDWAPELPALPEPTGDPVADFVARINAIAAARPSPFQSPSGTGKNSTRHRGE